MKFIVIFVISIIIAAKADSDSTLSTEEWKTFKMQHGKSYENEDEEAYRMQVYLNNLRLIEEHNKRYAEGKVSFKLGMNQFGDLPLHEFKQIMLNNHLKADELHERTTCKEQPPYNTSTINLSDSFNWVKKGAVTPAKDQGGCGSCWAFSAVGTLESHHYIKTGKLENLSEQNLVDCSKEYGNDGCNGGWPASALAYVVDNEGIDTEKSYPYTGQDNETCRYNASQVGARITSCRTLPPGDEEQLKIAVEKEGPISVTIYAASCEFQFYESGILYDNKCMPGRIDHAVVMVGFGSENGQDYWLAKNSWGEDWGQKGFFKIVRNFGNHCGIASYSSFPVSH